MKYINLFFCLLLWTEAVFAVSTTDNNKVIGRTLKVADKFVSGTNFVNGEFEDSTISGWTVAHSALTSLIPTSTTAAGTALSVGTGLTAATNLALTATSTNPLAGAYSGLLTASAASTAGDLLISPAISIPNSAKAKMITIGFSYSASSAINLSGTSSNSFAVYVYDIDNATWIQPAGVYGMIDGSTYAQVKNITFQTSSNGTKYQLAIVNINSIAAYTLKVDEVYFGTQPYSSGAAMSDWKSYSLVIGGTTTAPTKGTTSIDIAQWRRVGDSMEITYNFEQVTAGAAGSGDYLFPIPSGYSIDLTKLGVMNPARTIAGNCKLSTLAAGVGTATVPCTVLIGTTNPNAFKINYQYATEATANVGSSAYPMSLSFFSLSFTAKVPIVGWSSNTVQSADSDGRVVAYGVTGRSISSQIISNTTAKLTYTTNGAAVLTDTHSMGGTNQYTIPSSGYYDLNALANVGYSIVAMTCTHYLYVNKSGSNIDWSIFIGRGYNSMTAVPIDNIGISNTYWFNANDVISLYYQTDCNSDYVWLRSFSIRKNSGSPIAQASESVNLKYTASSGQTLTNNTATTILFDTKIFDSHGAYNPTTGIFTAPVSGVYRINVAMELGNYSWSSGQGMYTNLGGACTDLLDEFTVQNTITFFLINKGTSLCKMTQGQQLSVVSTQTRGSNTPLRAISTTNYLTIERIGN